MSEPVHETESAPEATAPATPSTASAAPTTRRAPTPSARNSGSISKRQLALFGAAALVAVWGVWVSKGVYDARHASNHIVKVQLSQIVQEYVQTTARSNLAPEQIGQQTAGFLKAVNDAVEVHRASGEVVLLANAVVAGNVPDITNEVRNEVYAKVARPQARVGNIDVQGEMQRYMAAGASSQANGH